MGGNRGGGDEARPVGGIVGVDLRGKGIDVIGQEGEDLGEGVDRRLLVGNEQRGHAARTGMGGGPAEIGRRDRDTGERFDHQRTGDECVCILGEDGDVGEPEEQGRSGDDRPAGGDENRHDAAAVHQLPSGLAPPCDACDAVMHRHAASRQGADDGQAMLAGRPERHLEQGGVGRGEGATIGASRDTEEHDSPSAEFGRPSSRTGGGVRSEQQGIGQ